MKQDQHLQIIIEFFLLNCENPFNSNACSVRKYSFIVTLTKNTLTSFKHEIVKWNQGRIGKFILGNLKWRSGQSNNIVCLKYIALSKILSWLNSGKQFNQQFNQSPSQMKNKSSRFRRMLTKHNWLFHLLRFTHVWMCMYNTLNNPFPAHINSKCLSQPYAEFYLEII